MKEKEEISEVDSNSYLTFLLGEEHFAVSVIKVIEILEVPKITVVPRAPDYLRGVINLRGSVLPVLDTRIKFNLSATEMTVSTCIVVLEVVIEDELVVLGALVDAVNEVIELKKEDIKPSPSLGGTYNIEFIEGVVRIKDEFIMLLNIGKVFSTDELNVLSEVASTETKNN